MTVLVAFPAEPLAEFNIGLRFPGQATLTGQYTGASLVVSRGPGYWVGTIGWGPLPRETQAGRIGRIEAFLAATQGAVGSFQVPVPWSGQKGRLGQGVSLVAQSSVVVPEGVEITTDQVHGLRAGDVFNAGSRLYRVLKDQAGYIVVAQPAIAPADGANLVWERPMLHARRVSGDAEISPRRGAYAGPWQLEIAEVVE